MGRGWSQSKARKRDLSRCDAVALERVGMRIRQSAPTWTSPRAGQSTSSKMATNGELVSEGHGFTEGPAINADGELFFTDLQGSKIWRIGQDGKEVLFQADTGSTNGLAFAPGWENSLRVPARSGASRILEYRQWRNDGPMLKKSGQTMLSWLTMGRCISLTRERRPFG